MKKLLAAGSMLVLASCTNTPVTVDNLTACSQALFAAGTSDPVKLLQTALATPACMALGEQVIQDIINRVSTQQRARGIR